MTPVKMYYFKYYWLFILAIFCHGMSFDDLKAQVNVQSMMNSNAILDPGKQDIQGAQHQTTSPRKQTLEAGEVPHIQ